MRVGAREGFPYKSVKLLLLANGTGKMVESNKFFLNGKAIYDCSFKVSPCSNSTFFDTHPYLYLRIVWFLAVDCGSSIYQCPIDLLRL
jgi:hypothetical protein